MKKITLHLYFAIAMVFVAVYYIVRYTLLFPVNIYRLCVNDFKVSISKLTHDARIHMPYFDCNGLRHNIDHINSIRIEEMIKWPLEEMEQYADIFAVNFCKGSHQITALIIEQELHYLDINPTSIGNAAYVVLHHPQLEEREKALKMLHLMEDKIHQKK